MLRKTEYQNKQGYSLVEVCVALLLTSISIYGLASVTNDFYGNYKYMQMKQESLSIKQNLKLILNNPQMCAKQFQVFKADFNNQYDSAGFELAKDMVGIDVVTGEVYENPSVIYTDGNMTKKFLEVGQEASFVGSNMKVESISFNNVQRNVVYGVSADSVIGDIDAGLTYEFTAEVVVVLNPIGIVKPNIVITLPVILQTSSVGFLTSCFNKSARPFISRVFRADMWSYTNDDSQRMMRFWGKELGGDATTTLTTVHAPLAVSGTCPSDTELVHVSSNCQFKGWIQGMVIPPPPVQPGPSKIYTGSIVEISPGVYQSTCNDELLAPQGGMVHGDWVNDLSLLCKYKTDVN